MQSLVGIAALLLTAVGFARGGIWGALTGLVTAIGTGSGLAILINAKGTELSSSASVRGFQRLGGLVAAVACLAGGIYGGWHRGWMWALLGYTLGVVGTLLLSAVASIAAGNRHAQRSSAGLPQASAGRVPLLPLAKFAECTSLGRANRMNVAPYVGHPFQCACGQTHAFDASASPVLRELSGMRLVIACPTSEYVTCVKVQGIMRFEGFASLFGTDGAHAHA